MKLGLIVEGHGEVLAAPALVTRVIQERLLRYEWIVQERPVRVKRGRFSDRFDDYERALQLVALHSEAILVVLDSDDDPPAELKADLQTRAERTVGHRKVAVTPAVKMWEAWFLAGLESLRGQLNVPLDATIDGDPEAIRGAAGRFKDLPDTKIYSKAVDQKKYTSILDLELTATRSPSFRFLLESLDQLTAV